MVGHNPESRSHLGRIKQGIVVTVASEWVTMERVPDDPNPTTLPEIVGSKNRGIEFCVLQIFLLFKIFFIPTIFYFSCFLIYFISFIFSNHDSENHDSELEQVSNAEKKN